MSRSNDNGAFLFSVLVKSSVALADVLGEMIDEKVHKEIKKQKMRQILDILEFQEDAKSKRSFYTPNEDEENRIVECIKKNDPEFNKELFEKFAEDVFRKFQKAYCENNLDSVRKFVDVNVIETFGVRSYQNQMNGYKETIDIADINYVDFFGYHNEGNVEVVSVAVGIVFKDYVVDETGEVIAGSDKYKKRSTYILSFARKIGGKTINNIKDYTEGSISHCPNCGADIINSFSQCESCGTVLFNSTESWLMNHIEEL